MTAPPGIAPARSPRSIDFSGIEDLKVIARRVLAEQDTQTEKK